MKSLSKQVLAVGALALMLGTGSGASAASVPSNQQEENIYFQLSDQKQEVFKQTLLNSEKESSQTINELESKYKEYEINYLNTVQEKKAAYVAAKKNKKSTAEILKATDALVAVLDQSNKLIDIKDSSEKKIKEAQATQQNKMKSLVDKFGTENKTMITKYKKVIESTGKAELSNTLNLVSDLKISNAKELAAKLDDITISQKAKDIDYLSLKNSQLFQNNFNYTMSKITLSVKKTNDTKVNSDYQKNISLNKQSASSAKTKAQQAYNTDKTSLSKKESQIKVVVK